MFETKATMKKKIKTHMKKCLKLFLNYLTYSKKIFVKTIQKLTFPAEKNISATTSLALDSLIFCSLRVFQLRKPC